MEDRNKVMKKVLGITMICSALLLSACQSNTVKEAKSTPASTSSAKKQTKTSTTSSKKQEKPKTSINAPTEVTSNYPELYGQWKNEAGSTLQVDADGALHFKSSTNSDGHIKGNAFQLTGQEYDKGLLSYQYELDLTGFTDILYMPKDNNAGKFLIGDESKERLLLNRSNASNETTDPEVLKEILFYKESDNQADKVKKNGIDLIATQLEDYSTIEGQWSNGQETLDFSQKLNEFKSGSDVRVTSDLKDNTLKFLMTPEIGGPFYYIIYPAGTTTMDLEGAQIANEDDTSKDRVLVMQEIYASFYYRESDASVNTTKSSNNDFTGIEAELEDFMIDFRNAVNETISTKKDHMADLYVSTDNSAYKETLGWYMDAPEPYKNVSTKSFSNIKEDGDTISFDVVIDNNGTDSSRFYKLKKVDGNYKILEFRY